MRCGVFFGLLAVFGKITSQADMQATPVRGCAALPTSRLRVCVRNIRYEHAEIVVTLEKLGLG